MPKKAVTPAPNRDRVRRPREAPQRTAPRRPPQGELADAGASDEEVDTTYPKALYRKVKPSAKTPNGYETRRVYDDADEALRVGEGWKASPEGMTSEFPFGHQD